MSNLSKFFRAMLKVTLMLAVVQIVLLIVSVGSGFLLHWVLPSLDFSIAVLLCFLSITLSIYLCFRAAVLLPSLQRDAAKIMAEIQMEDEPEAELSPAEWEEAMEKEGLDVHFHMPPRNRRRDGSKRRR
jgi:hypothetical protein